MSLARQLYVAENGDADGETIEVEHDRD